MSQFAVTKPSSHIRPLGLLPLHVIIQLPSNLSRLVHVALGIGLAAGYQDSPHPSQTLTQHHKLLLRCVVLGRIDLSTILTSRLSQVTNATLRDHIHDPVTSNHDDQLAGPSWAYLSAYQGQSVHREVASLLEAEHSRINRHQQTSDGQHC